MEKQEKIELPTYIKPNNGLNQQVNGDNQHIDILIRNGKKGIYFDNTIKSTLPAPAAIKFLLTNFNQLKNKPYHFQIEVHYGMITWYFTKYFNENFGFQLKNNRPIAGFPLPQKRWGLRIGTDKTPFLNGQFFNNSTRQHIYTTLPKSHALPPAEARNTFYAMISQSYVDDTPSTPLDKYLEQIKYDPQYWEDTGLCVRDRMIVDNLVAMLYSGLRTCWKKS